MNYYFYPTPELKTYSLKTANEPVLDNHYFMTSQ